MTENPNDVLFEMRRIGNIMRVTAIHAATGTEVVIQGPATSSPSSLQKVALNKLQYVLKNRQD